MLAKSKYIAGLICWLLLAPAARAILPTDAAARSGNLTGTNSTLQPYGSEGGKWLTDWDAAQRLAARDNRSLFVYFHSPVCTWCQRMDQEVFTAIEVRRRLGEFVLLKVNILEDEKTPARFRVRGTPTLVFLSPEGRESLRVDSFIDKDGLLERFDQILANRVLSQDERTASLISQIRDHKLPGANWAEVLIALADSRYREEIRQAILTSSPQPREDLVRLLQHPLLAVRLGALEILEELTGDDFGFNPWLEQPSQNQETLQKWLAWVASTNSVSTNQPTIYRVLTPDEAAKYLIDYTSDDLDRAGRARRMLDRGGESSLAGIDAFLASHTDLPTGSRSKLRELRYSLQLPSVRGLDSASLAHRMVFGNLDVRLRAMRDCAAASQRAVPVLQEFLSEPEPLVRETAVDALVAAGQRRVVGLLDEHLKKETDANVTYAILRQLGNLRSKKAVDILARYVDHANEDLVIVALESLAKLRSDAASEKIGKCLEDQRWRVRVAALKASEDLQLKSLATKVTSMLSDKDEFVRAAAVGALAKLGAKPALPKLETMFAQEDSLKGPIVEALFAADLVLPESIIKSLSNTPPSVLLGMLDHVKRPDLKVAPLLVMLAAHKDSDVACAALQALATHGMEHGPYQKVVAEQIQSSDRRRVLAIMNALEIETKHVARYNPAVTKVDFGAPQAVAPARSQTVADEVFAAFENKAAPAKGASKASAVDDVFGAFEGKTGPVENYIQTLTRVGKETLQKRDAELKSAAARMLLLLGDTTGVSQIIKDLPELSAEQRSLLAHRLGSVRNRDGLPLIQRLLADADSDIREAVCDELMENGGSEASLQLMFAELERPGAVLKPSEVFQSLQSVSAKGSMKTAINKAATNWLKTAKDQNLQTLGLILIGGAWSSGNESMVEPFLKAENPWQRRAAFYALGRNKRDQFLKAAESAAADPSEFVREVVTHIFLPEGVWDSWMQYFDDQKQHQDYNRSYSFSSRRELMPLEPEALAALHKLEKDRSDRVRFQALYCLITQEQPVDLGDVVRLLERMPQDSELLEHFSTHIRDHYNSLGKEFAAVLPYLNFGHYGRDDERMQRLLDYFGLGEAEGPVKTEASGAVPRQLVASYVAAPVVKAAASAVRPENFQIVYFFKPGCKECEAVSRKITQLKETFPSLVIHEFDINKTAAVLMNEALSSKFNVPASVRLVAPSVFSGDGFLIKDDITLDRLGQMLMRAGSVPVTNWLVLPEESLAVAHQDIVKRYETTGPGLIIFAGLLDGINPCAFATIIFLLSYLQVTRKSSRQILQIGMAYVLGVFLAYFTIGLGLAKIAAIVTRFRFAGTILTWLMAGFALVIMLLSIRDGVLAMRGQLSEMTLQLPEFLKARIHGTVRQGVRQAHFVLVAFFMGVTISFLELACTGQVYLPTITYMIQQGEARATLGLLTYNIAFILPLVAVFVAAHYGLRSEALVGLLKKRAAMVKFGTAILFFFLAAFLILGRH